jgi:hypothetical protein
MTRVLLACALLGVAQPATKYQFDAGGRPARIDQSWELLSGDNAISILPGFARCGRQIFVSDDQFTIYRVDAEKPSQRLARFAGEDRGIGRASALAADCAGERLYVVNAGPRTVASLDMASGAVVASRPYKRDFYEARALTLLSPSEVMISGFWNPDYLAKPITARADIAFWDGTSIGQRVSLDSGATTPGVAPYESRCIAAGACLSSDLDAIGEGASRGWIASIATSTRVALYDAGGARTSSIEVRSPMFVRDGTEVPMTTRGATEYERWRGRNSVIRRVFSIGRYLVVVHTKTIQGPDWVFGQDPQYDVHMNLYLADGAPLTSDVRLPGVPVGKDATHLYAIDYGPKGRGQSPDKVTLVRIPIEAGSAIVR